MSQEAMQQQRLEETYLVDNVYLLHIKEEQDGFRYHCLNKNDGGQTYNGLITWSDIEESPVLSALAAARIEAIQEIGLAGEIVRGEKDDGSKRSKEHCGVCNSEMAGE